MPAKVVTYGTTRQDLGITAGESYRDGNYQQYHLSRSFHFALAGSRVSAVEVKAQLSRVDSPSLPDGLGEHHPGSGIPLPQRRVTKAKPSPSLAPPALWLEYHATQKAKTPQEGRRPALGQYKPYPRVSGISVAACFRLMTRL